QMKDYHRLRRVNPDYAPRNYEARLVTRNGNVKPVHLTVAMIPGTEKSMASILDMTELRRSKMAIKESQERFKSIFDNAAEAIILFDCQGNIVESNDKIKEIFGFKNGEIIGQNFVDMMSMMGMDYEDAKMILEDLISG